MFLERLRPETTNKEIQGKEEGTVIPLLKHLYERIEEIDLTEERFLGQGGALELMEVVEKDQGFMDLVSLVGEDNITGGAFAVSVNSSGFYINYWYGTSEPEIYTKEKVLDLGNAQDPVDAETIKKGLLNFVKEAPWKEDGWLHRGSSRTGMQMPPVTGSHFPSLLIYPDPHSY